MGGLETCETEGYISVYQKVTEAKGLAEFTSNGSGRRQIGRRTSYNRTATPGLQRRGVAGKNGAPRTRSTVPRQRDMH
ncbi:hypothetical protein CKAH01_17189 [Colletotrichum kahawae]|uniref:Uncharacterized protein n=1 Tax=Colletotrichum kahawae TaxID=34407 RepID=A0AAD9YDG5_COLKA|nr:hypothetical protein CKAH01_17189 [Colletotrichum kahawae]